MCIRDRPKNIWLYVSQIPNLSAIGTRFLLQGGTQYNLSLIHILHIAERMKTEGAPKAAERELAAVAN